MTKDYYRILGVLDDAEDIVIRAAYKALAQRYHPDKWKGGQEEANRRMSEINEAFSTLSDAEKRKNYDQNRESLKYGNDVETETVAKESSDFLDVINKDWTIAKNHFPEIEDNFEDLQKFSYPLAVSYKLVLLDTQMFEENHAIYMRLKAGFLKTYFGEKILVTNFAQELILEGQIKAAKELNDHVRVLGNSLIAEKVIIEIGQKYHIKRVVAEQKDLEREKLLQRKVDKIFGRGLLIIFGFLVLGGCWLLFGLFSTFIFALIGSGLFGAFYLLKVTGSDDTKIIECPKCKSSFKAPSGKHIEVTCKTCAHIWKIHT